MHNTIKSDAVIARLFASGDKIKTRNLIVLFEQVQGVCGQNAFIAGKRLGSAPLRNRSKRRLREAVAQSERQFDGKQKQACRCYNIIYMARQKTASCPFTELEQDVISVRHKIMKVGQRDEL